jgi:peptidoglycan/xylan/chitin deacetylase (PgdA/CDA1 family)
MRTGGVACSAIPQHHRDDRRVDVSRLVISLDFELMWGVRDKRSIPGYGRNILGVRQAVPAMLDLFRRYRVKATWAAVGLLMFRRRSELLEHLPAVQPAYANGALSPYDPGYLAHLGDGEDSDPYHYGASLVDRIVQTEGMELASHTFSHYYCLEKGQTEREFSADLRAAIRACAPWGVRPVSLVFPRNQFNPSYLAVCSDLGFRAFRGNEDSWIYRAASGDEESSVRRAVRLLDNYVDLSGAHGFEPRRVPGSDLVNVPASRFLRPYHPALSRLESVRLKRITSAMRSTAARGQCFHLWWHPHNFGANLQENLHALDDVLRCFAHLRDEFGMRSCTMADVAREVKA